MRRPLILSCTLTAALALGACDQGALVVDTGEAATDFSEHGEEFEKVGTSQGQIDPARVTLRRLNRAEYNNTVRDLLGTEQSPADTFPEDDFGYGFNTIGDVLSLSPTHMEAYQLAAESLVVEALGTSAGTGGTGGAQSGRVEAESASGTSGSAGENAWALTSNGQVGSVVQVDGGEYAVRVRAWARQGGPGVAQMELRVNGQVVETFDVAAEAGAPATYETVTELPAGGVELAAAFINDFYDPDNGIDRNLFVDWIEFEGTTPAAEPADPAEAGSPREQLLVCTPQGEAEEAGCAGDIFGAFARRAWRRPVGGEEVDRIVALYELARTEGLDHEGGVAIGLQAILLSPHFIFKVELDDDPESATPHLLSNHELAVRLSYFLWSTMPDAELMRLADEGSLQDEDVLRAQVQRMMQDPRADSLVNNFATQWLHLDEVLESTPDYEVFPDFDDELAQAMRAESRMFVRDLFVENRPIEDMLVANYTYVNGRLAAHYDIPGVTGDDMQRVELQGESRGGLLTQGGILTALSFPKRTSPVKRGEWVLEALLCSAPPAAPPGVENLPDEQMDGEVEGTLRERMARHAEDPSCRGCHYMMDPIGFGMEHYDGVGRWRDLDNGLPIDASGELPGERAFNGVFELSSIVSEDPKYATCVTEKFLTYALGRGVETWDHPQIEAILDETAAGGYRTQDIIEAIVTSPAFRMRRGGELQETSK